MSRRGKTRLPQGLLSAWPGWPVWVEVLAPARWHFRRWRANTSPKQQMAGVVWDRWAVGRWDARESERNYPAKIQGSSDLDGSLDITPPRRARRQEIPFTAQCARAVYAARHGTASQQPTGPHMPCMQGAPRPSSARRPRISDRALAHHHGRYHGHHGALTSWTTMSTCCPAAQSVSLPVCPVSLDLDGGAQHAPLGP